MTTNALQALDPTTRQAALEEDMRCAGTERFRTLVAKARAAEREAETPYGSYLIAHHILPISKGITDFIEQARTGAGGRRHSSLPYLEAIDPDTAAYIACKGAMNGITGKLRYQNVAVKIGSMIEDEVRFRAFEETEILNPRTGETQPGRYYFAKVKKSLDEESNHYRHKRLVLVRAMKRQGVTWSDWPVKDKLHLGCKLLELVEATGLVERIFLTNRKKTEFYLTATQVTLEWIAHRNEWTELMCPIFQPMIMPPKAWSTPRNGGYLNFRTPLVKTRNKAYQEELFSTDLTLVYEAVNGLQETAWQINQAVYTVMAEAWKVGTGFIGGLPSRDHKPDPPKPHDIATNKEARKDWRKKKHIVVKDNFKSGSKVLQVDGIIETAKKFLNEPAMYFPYTLDFRGRVYSVPSGLTPQGHDIAKGLLTFANGKPLGTQRAADWLAIHGANLFGYDKVSLEDRVKWVKDNQKNILQTVLSPLDFRWWDDADKPWQFLAFCYEWVGYMRAGLDFVSHLPIALDGSCNGLQHFSAMLRDPVGGAATNLVPASKPRDIYQTVIDRVIQKLAGEDSEMARKWLAFGLNRHTAKRPVMVVPYGGTQHSTKKYLNEHVLERVKNGEANPWANEREVFTACVYLARFMWEAISETVVAARDAMAWLQEVSAVVSTVGKPINWTAPTGFKPQQAYPQMKEIKVTTKIAGESIQLHLLEETQVLDKRRQGQGISPNFVHSLDAAALMFTVVAALDHGIDSFGMVHDSYATVAADTDKLRDCLRQSFCQMYQMDVLKEFRDEIQKALPSGVELPPLPAKGTLDINLVLQSDFFFA